MKKLVVSFLTVALMLLLGLFGSVGCADKSSFNEKTNNVEDYLYFGKYPQTIKSPDVTVGDTANTDGYYIGSDGELYEKIVAYPIAKYCLFSDETICEQGKTYYFKVEPIKWRILSENNGVALLLCDNILIDIHFDDVDNNYGESYIREWLNNTFVDIAFSEKETERFKMFVEESSGITGDKVFLPSYEEVTKSDYGFGEGKTADEQRRILTSDFCRAFGGKMSTNVMNYGCGDWWLRSPSSDSNVFSKVVRNSGDTYLSSTHVTTRMGIVPALQIILK